MRAVTRALERSATPQLGPVEEWPQGLCATVNIVLGSRLPMLIAGDPISECSTTARVYRTAQGMRVSTELGLESRPARNLINQGSLLYGYGR
jgi:hypothetical protein